MSASQLAALIFSARQELIEQGPQSAKGVAAMGNGVFLLLARPRFFRCKTAAGRRKPTDLGFLVAVDYFGPEKVFFYLTGTLYGCPPVSGPFATSRPMR